MNRQLIALASRTLGDAHHREQQDALNVEGRLREHFKLVGTPLRVEMRSSRNPFDEKGS
mgnify:CR=1 FL=1